MIWSFILAGLGVVSLILTGRKKKSGWVVALINSGLWVIYAITSGQYGFLMSSAIFIIVQTRNLIAWAKDDREANHPS